MDTIGISKTLFTLPSSISPRNGEVSKLAAASIPVTAPVSPQTQNQAQFDPVAAAQRRAEAVRRQVQDTFVVSDKSFSIFKDASGQYITRYTSLRDGKVTYIPEPDLFSMQSHGQGGELVKIEA